MDNKDLLQKIRDEVIIGLVEEFGAEPIPVEQQVPQSQSDMTIIEQIFADASKKRAPKSTEPLKPIIKPNPKLAEEITNNDN